MTATEQQSPIASPPATPNQIKTIQRLERVLHGTRGQKTDTSALTRAEASELIGALIEQTNRLADDGNEDEGAVQQRLSQAVTQPAPAPQPVQAVQRTPEQGEWPPVPPQSSEAQPTEALIESMGGAQGALPADDSTLARPAFRPVPTLAQARADDNPFAADGDEELGTLGDEDEAEDPELVRTVPAPVGGPFAFQILSADWVPPKNSQYGGIRLTCVGLPAGNEAGKTADGTEAGDYLSMNPNSRWRHEALLAAINEERCKRSQLAGHTFWATTEEDNWERTNEETGETRVIKRTRIKDYLEGPSPKPLSNGRVNGTAAPAKPVAKLGAEFSA